MPHASEANRTAWQPLTPGGIAVFADATWRRLLLVQFVFAGLVAGCVVWLLATAWFPVIEQAIDRLPAEAEIRSRKLKWPEPMPQLLAERHFLAIAADLNHTGTIRSPAHVQVELGEHTIRFISLFGFAECAYPTGDWVIALNRAEVQPWWGAWGPPTLWITFVLVIVGLLGVWSVRAMVYSLPTWLLGFFLNRQISERGSYTLCGAALMPGTFVIAGAILFYGFGILDLVQLMAGGIIHVLVGFIYALLSVFFTAKLSGSSTKGNPFAG
jgi:hypothetical protein